MKQELDMTAFGKRLKEARTEKGMTQKDLADLSGVSTVMISSYERSEAETGKNPALSSIFSIASALDVSIDWLCGRTDKKSVKPKIDTKTFLLCYLSFFNSGGVGKLSDRQLQKMIKNMKSSFNGISLDIYKPIFGEKKAKTIYHFTKDYFEVLPVLRNGGLPLEIQNTIITKIIDDYKDIPIKQLLSNGFSIDGCNIVQLDLRQEDGDPNAHN